jgi:hypothetical protein
VETKINFMKTSFTTNLIDKIVRKFSIIRYNKRLLKRAIIEAKKNWIKTGKQHFVIYVENKYIVIDNDSIDKLKKPNGQRFTAIERRAMACYVTPASTFHNI